MRLSRITLVAAAAVAAVAGAALAGVVAHASSTQTTIRVTEKEYSIKLSTKAPPSGRVKFVVRDTGKFPHALAIKGAGVSKRTPLIKPGKSAVLVATLKSGTYNVWCPVPGHAALGMKAALTVKGTAAGGGGGSTSTSGATTTTGTIPWG